MVAAARLPIRIAGACLLKLALFACLLSVARAQEPARQDGLFITVANPITSDVVESIKAKTQRALERTDRPIRTIVFDFNSGDQLSGHASSTKAYGPCHDLAAFLLEQQAVNTVAFVHNDVSAHTILPVLACKDIVMSAEAKIGNTQQELPRLLEDEVQFYDHVARSRGRCPAIILKMLKPDLEVVEGNRLGGVWYIDKSKLAQETAQGFTLTGQEPVLPRGQLGYYSAAQAQKFGLCTLIKETRADVAERYGLTPSSLREDPLEGRDPRPFRIKLAEPLTGAVAERLHRQIRQAVGRKANVLILQLESSHGEATPALDLAEALRNLKDDRGEFPVMTIAYIPKEAPGAATILALGCNEIVMGPAAQIGDFSQFTHEPRGWNGQVAEVDPERYRLLRTSLVDLAREQGYSPLLAQGMLDRSLTIYQVQDLKNPSEWKLISQEEWDQDQAPQGPKKWRNPPVLIKRGGANGEFLKLDAATARSVALARDVVENFSELCAKYGFKERDVRDMGYDFLYRFAEFLRHPAVALFLIMIGIACLILELKVPGVGLPGVVAAICFVLYFWAHTQQLSGQIIALAVLLFVLGLVLIGLEIFVLPGSFVMGISGVGLIVVSLALATLEKKPETSQEWLSFGQTMGAIGGSLVVAVTLAFLVAWYLPSIPYASRLILKPPADTVEGTTADELAGAAPASGYPDLAPLLGAVGVATTTLRPAGIARFGDQFVDVVTEGSFVPAGSRLQVIEIEGNRVVVKEV
jgi:membrane-bound ClpP family serine protease